MLRTLREILAIDKTDKMSGFKSCMGIGGLARTTLFASFDADGQVTSSFLKSLISLVRSLRD